MNNHWSDNLRKRMEAHEEPTPDKLWEGIEQAVKNKQTFNTSSQKKHLWLWTKRIGASAAIIAFCLIGYLNLEKNHKDASPSISKFSQNDQKSFSEIVEEIKIENNILAESKKQQKIESLRMKDSIYDKTIDIQEEKTIENIKEKEPSISKEHKESGKKKSLTELDNKLDLVFESDIVSQKKTSDQWQTSLYASNISSTSTDKYSGYGNLTSSRNCLENEGTHPDREDALGNIFINNEYQEVYTDIKHKQPITIGLSINYNLNEKWSITSGLVYTMLSSDLRSGSDNYYYRSKQTLHYIGLPLNINYNLWKNKRLSVYTSAGTLVEKNISGKLNTDYILDNKVESRKEKKISVDELQWSIAGSMGIQYNFSKKIGIYTEPGISYYFKNKSKIETIYAEQPVSFKLQVGLRLSLGR